MASNQVKQRTLSRKTEDHTTAAWANIEEIEPVSRVSFPSLFAVEEAKDWVDDYNQK